MLRLSEPLSSRVPYSFGASGSQTTNAAPDPGSLSTRIVPP
jgi:hypothetical protein